MGSKASIFRHQFKKILSTEPCVLNFIIYVEESLPNKVCSTLVVCGTHESIWPEWSSFALYGDCCGINNTQELKHFVSSWGNLKAAIVHWNKDVCMTHILMYTYLERFRITWNDDKINGLDEPWFYAHLLSGRSVKSINLIIDCSTLPICQTRVI